MGVVDNFKENKKRKKMEVNQALSDTENALRDFINFVLERKYGEKYIEHFGVSQDRLQKWEERKSEEAKKISSTAVEERLIYYSDFYDLKTIIRKNWAESTELRTTFEDLKKVEFYLDELDKYRNPDAHRRNFLPHQKDLINGICGEIRSRIIKFRSTEDTGESYFPRLEFIRNNIGNSWQFGQNKTIDTKQTLYVGDQIEFIITATDPEDMQLEYYCSVDSMFYPTNSFRINITESQIGKQASIQVGIKSPREYHAVQGNQLDDWITFLYTILPKRK